MKRRKINIIHKRNLFFFIIILFLLPVKFYAQETNYIAISSAVFDILQQVDPAYETRIEFRLGETNLWGHPFSGIMVNTGGAAFLYLGLYYDIPVGDYFYITPSFAPGLYAKNKSKDLNLVLQFRSQIEIAYKFENKSRISIGFSHVSNASLGKENPGVESLVLTYIIPL
ncbi:MAG TPA: acyloxyacyl hydrolase [Ignavibacteriales bacterium]|nr:acyloxyacyl hydrolase [Ignavibacteriales bacterium]